MQRQIPASRSVTVVGPVIDEALLIAVESRIDATLARLQACLSKTPRITPNVRRGLEILDALYRVRDLERPA